MDARAFDAITRAFGIAGTRRRLIGGLAGLVAGGAVVRSAAADTEGPVGGSDGTEGPGGEPGNGTGTDFCIPRPGLVAAAVAVEPPFTALISAGTCGQLDTAITYDLFDVQPGGQADEEEGEAVGATSGITAIQSTTTVRVGLGDLLTTPHAVVIRAGADDETPIVCGDIGGLRVGDDLAVGLRDVSGSGYGGIAWLRGQNGSTLAYLFLAPGLGGASGVPVGAAVVTTDEVNLRSGPSTEASVVTLLPAGAELAVTGEAQGDWLPVEVVATGETGFVAAQFLAAAG
ncbi:MAG: SH3 domain-containing protein [Thermomicrobiales bacterium]